jgi:methenyltetrahydrofolate cyclohydrolase
MSNPPELLVDLSVRGFTEKLASPEAAPGGGSAAALAGGLAAALAGMVAGLTAGRPKYAEHEVEMQAVLEQAQRLRGQLLALVDADTVAYENVVAAYRLPKDSDEQKASRSQAVQDAMKHAADIPLATAEACVQVLNIAALTAEHGNPNASSDAAVAGLLAHAGLVGAVRNVRINLKQIKDAEFCGAAEARVSGLVANAEAALKRALDE